MSLPQLRALEKACLRVRAEKQIGDVNVLVTSINAAWSKDGASAAKKFVGELQRIAGTEEEQ